MIVKKQWFTYQKEPDSYYVTIITNPKLDFPMKYIDNKSNHLAPARVLNLDYVQYLYFLIVMFPEDTEVRIEDNFPIIYWERNPAFYTFLQLLNARLSLIMEGDING